MRGWGYPVDMRRVALALLRGSTARAERPRDPTGESALRRYLFDEQFSPVWDERLLDGIPGRHALPEWVRLAREVHRRSDEYDAIVTWGERLSLALMALQRFSRNPKPHVAMMYQFSKPNVYLPMRLFGRSLHALVSWTSVQRRYAIEHLGFPGERLYLLRHYVDQLFFRPRECEQDTICAVGAEMRDYATLLTALRGTELRCHVATDHVRIPGKLRLVADCRVPIGTLQETPDAKVTLGRLTLHGLRDLYARSRFVVVPLAPSNTDNGITVLLEAMAMGKAVICSRTQGQVDVIEDGVTGLFVPVGDPSALRTAIVALWNDPERARAIGARARAYVVKNHSLDGFCANVRGAVEASLAGRDALATGWWEEPVRERGAPQAPKAT